MLCNRKTKQLLETGKRRRIRRTVGVYFGCLPNPEFGILSGTGGKDEEQEKENGAKEKENHKIGGRERKRDERLSKG
jgi:hypothetical protein